MIRNEVKLIGRLTADPELKYTKKTNKALCNVVLAVNSIYSNEAEYLHLVFWNKTAENLCKYKGKGDLIAVTGYLKTRSYIDKENIVRNIVEPKKELTKAKQYRSLTLTTRNRKSIR
mgnify:CR=1 FL=1